jgi:hypothetical protein
MFPIPDVPPSAPVIHGIKLRYKVNDIIRGNCTSKGSRPAANLTWTINDMIVRPIYFRGSFFAGFGVEKTPFRVQSSGKFMYSS